MSEEKPPLSVRLLWTLQDMESEGWHRHSKKRGSWEAVADAIDEVKATEAVQKQEKK